jgi:hypothetical protein
MTNIHNLHLHLFINTWTFHCFFKKLINKSISSVFSLITSSPFATFFTLAYWFDILELLVYLSWDTAIDLLKANDFFILSSSCCWHFLSLNNYFFVSKGIVIQISGGIRTNLHTIAVLVGVTVANSSSELHESWIWISLVIINNFWIYLSLLYWMTG